MSLDLRAVDDLNTADRRREMRDSVEERGADDDNWYRKQADESSPDDSDDEQIRSRSSENELHNPRKSLLGRIKSSVGKGVRISSNDRHVRAHSSEYESGSGHPGHHGMMASNNHQWAPPVSNLGNDSSQEIPGMLMMECDDIGPEKSILPPESWQMIWNEITSGRHPPVNSPPTNPVNNIPASSPPPLESIPDILGDNTPTSPPPPPLERIPDILGDNSPTSPPPHPLERIPENFVENTQGNTCVICEITFDNSSLLQAHMRTHEKQGRFACSACPKDFQSAAALKIHFRVHTGEKPFPCNVCGKRFTQAGNLKGHLKRHSGEKAHTCHACGKSYTDAVTYFKHMETHQSNDLHTCGLCGKKFMSHAHIMEHMKTHDGGQVKLEQPPDQGESPPGSSPLEVSPPGASPFGFPPVMGTPKSIGKPFGCSICGKRYTQFSGLQIHMAKHVDLSFPPKS